MEGEDQGSSRGAGTRLVQDQRCARDSLLRQAWEEGKRLFCLEDNRYAVRVHMLIITCRSLEGQTLART